MYRWVGNLMIVKQFWDGGVDPLIGVLSENVNTRWGKRKPIMVLSMWPSALMWILMWSSPNFSDSIGLRISYYGVAILLFSTFDSLVVVPYQSLIPDMSEGYHSRTFVVLFTQIFMFIGTGMASFIWSTLVEVFPVDTEDPLQAGMQYNYFRGYLVAAFIIIVPVIVAYLVSVVAAVERVDEDEKKKSIGYPTTDDEESIEMLLSKRAKVWRWIKVQLQEIKEICSYLPFIVVLAFAIFNMVGAGLFTTNFILWIKYDLENEPATGVSLLTLQVMSRFSSL
jgi:Na+/melibiose symporter-like transporter